MHLVKRTYHYLNEAVPSSTLAFFRIAFGLLMFGSILRFMLNGWVNTQLISPQYHFTYYGFDWIQPIGATGMYVLFSVLLLATIAITLGFKYRIAAWLFAIGFTYVELIDVSNYLNHYYFISIVAFMMAVLPANAYFSLDTYFNPNILRKEFPRWTIVMIRFELAIVYFYAGLAKVNHEWLIEAMPLKYWLPAQSHLPVIGDVLDIPWIAYVFAWFGCLYDLTIPFFLSIKKTRALAYVAVIVFHVLTSILFQIGVFPYVMIVSTLIFFDAAFHQQCIQGIKSIFSRFLGQKNVSTSLSKNVSTKYRLPYEITFALIVIHFTFQLLFPFRYVLYPNNDTWKAANRFWNEQGFRFGWRVMLIEKAGYTEFTVTDPSTGKYSVVSPNCYLTKQQEKMMSTQPDMILQFAHWLKEDYEKKGIQDPEVRVDAFVSLNGRGSKRFIDPTVDLGKLKDSWSHKDWVLSIEDE